MCVYTSTLSKQVTTCSRWIEEGKERKKKETHVPLDGGYFPSQQEASVHPDTNGLVPLFKQKVFPESSREPEGKDSQQMFSLSESRRYSAGNVVPWFDNSGNAAIRVD